MLGRGHLLFGDHLPSSGPRSLPQGGGQFCSDFALLQFSPGPGPRLQLWKQTPPCPHPLLQAVVQGAPLPAFLPFPGAQGCRGAGGLAWGGWLAQGSSVGGREGSGPWAEVSEGLPVQRLASILGPAVNEQGDRPRHPSLLLPLPSYKNALSPTLNALCSELSHYPC